MIVFSDHNASPDFKKNPRKSDKCTRKFRTIEEKYEIIKAIELNPDKKHRKLVQAKYDISRSTFCDILNHKEEIIKAYEGDEHRRHSSHLTPYSCKDPERQRIDEELMNWYVNHIKEPELLPSQRDLADRANRIAAGLGYEIELNMSWIQRWKERHGFVKKLSKYCLKEERGDKFETQC